jgi:hypothetical protein
MSDNGRHRLTSWKEIATHLGRAVRTVLRWEKERGLPVHRVPGANGRVVFAYSDELDTWAQGEGRAALAAEPLPAAPAVRVDGRWTAWRLTAVLVVISVAGVALTAIARRDTRAMTVVVAPDGITAVGADGATRWRYGFPSGERASPLENRFPGAGDVVDGPDAGVIAGTAMQFRDPASDNRGGRLFSFSRGGELRRTFSFDDRLTFGSGAYGAPWALTGFHVDASAGRQRVAVAAHHYEWWPSMVTILDDHWTRHGTFVNAGWIEGVWWLDRRRLVIAGFSNPGDGGMIALLDADALDGESPLVPGGDDYRCTTCGAGRPIRYIVMPRSEVNRASGSPFNRVVLQPKPDGFVARTIEIPASNPGGVADIIYEFSTSLTLVRATHSDRYWEAHRALEAQGKIGHSRAQCPDRNGPSAVRVWEPSTGWGSGGVTRLTESRPRAR